MHTQLVYHRGEVQRRAQTGRTNLARAGQSGAPCAAGFTPSISKLTVEWKTMKKKRRSICIVVTILVAFLLACNSKDPLDLLLKELEEGAENRDVRVFEKRLASSFTGNDDIARVESLATLRRYFIAYERIDVDLANVERKSGNRVNFRVTFSGKVNAAFNLESLLPSRAVYHFELWLVQEEGMPKVQKAFWKEVPGL